MGSLMNKQLRNLLIVTVGLGTGATLSILWSEVRATEDVVRTVIPYQGSLVDDDGVPLTGTVDLTFLLIGPSGVEWNETFTGVRLRRGDFSVALGSDRALPPWAFTSTGIRLRVAVNGVWLTGEQQLASLPFSYLSLSASDLVVSSTLSVGERYDSGSVAASGAATAESLTTRGPIQIQGNLILGEAHDNTVPNDPAPLGLSVAGSATLPNTVNLTGGTTITSATNSLSFNGPQGLHLQNVGGSLTTSTTTIDIDGAGTVSIVGESANGQPLILSNDGLTLNSGSIRFEVDGSTSAQSSLRLGSVAGSTTIDRSNVVTRSVLRGDTDRNGKSGSYSSTVNLTGPGNVPYTRTNGFCGLAAVGVGARHYQTSLCRVYVNRQGQWAMEVDVDRSRSNSWDNGVRCQAQCFRY
jgi:hypothetical protein